MDNKEIEYVFCAMYNDHASYALHIDDQSTPQLKKSVKNFYSENTGVEIRRLLMKDAIPLVQRYIKDYRGKS